MKVSIHSNLFVKLLLMSTIVSGSVTFPTICLADESPLRIELPGTSLFETKAVPAILWKPFLERSRALKTICKQLAPTDEDELLNYVVKFIDNRLARYSSELENSSGPPEPYQITCGGGAMFEFNKDHRWKSITQTNTIMLFHIVRKDMDKLNDCYRPYLQERLELKTGSRSQPKVITGYPPTPKPFDFGFDRSLEIPSRRPLTADEAAQVTKQAQMHRAQLVALAGSSAVDQLDVRLDSILERHPATQQEEPKANASDQKTANAAAD